MPGRSVSGSRGPRTSQQDALRRARQLLEDAITQPADEKWAKNLLAALQKAWRVFRLHVLESEAEDGSLEEILTMKPQLAKRVALLRGEHVSLREEIAVLCAQVLEQIETAKTDVEALRLESGRVLDHLRLHQAKGIDLVYEAFLRVEGGEGP